ncbi:MAG: hypothetical protein WBK20_02800 [Spirochaetota bacterium]
MQMFAISSLFLQSPLFFTVTIAPVLLKKKNINATITSRQTNESALKISDIIKQMLKENNVSMAINIFVRGYAKNLKTHSCLLLGILHYIPANGLL